MKKSDDFVRVSNSIVVGAVGAILLATHCVAGQQPPLKADPKIAVEQFLREYLHDPQFGKEKTTQFSIAFVSLDGSPRNEVVVYLSGTDWCGSGGCTLLVLEPNGSSYSVVGRTTIVRLPVRVLNTRTNGWRDLSVWVRGGGIRPGYEAALPFNGTKYASNPSVPPARPLKKGAPGEVIIPESGNADTTSTPR
jgi:hypothetical protein